MIVGCCKCACVCEKQNKTNLSGMVVSGWRFAHFLVEFVVRGSVLLNFGLLVELGVRRHCGVGPRVSMVRCKGLGSRVKTGSNPKMMVQLEDV